MKILSVVGARPNFMKVAPLHRLLLFKEGIDAKVIHTGQHYDERMSDIFFRQLELPEPDIFLGVGSGSHAVQTSKIMVKFEKVVDDENPDLVIVVGDVNSTVACTLVAKKKHVKVAHIEAGLRSFDRKMPEEINRIVTDSISDLLFVTEESGEKNLQNEGIKNHKIKMVGNVMIDSLLHFQTKSQKLKVLEKLGVEKNNYGLVTLHRPSNVDDEQSLSQALEILQKVSKRIPLVFPIHPRTYKNARKYGLDSYLDNNKKIIVTDPQGYLEFLNLMENARVVITDSGGIQEETTFLKVPCLTLRDNTERPITVEKGSNTLLPMDKQQIINKVEEVLEGKYKRGEVPHLWDGKAANRIVNVLLN